MYMGIWLKASDWMLTHFAFILFKFCFQADDYLKEVIWCITVLCINKDEIGAVTLEYNRTEISYVWVNQTEAP